MALDQERRLQCTSPNQVSSYCCMAPDNVSPHEKHRETLGPQSQGITYQLDCPERELKHFIASTVVWSSSGVAAARRFRAGLDAVLQVKHVFCAAGLLIRLILGRHD